MEHPLKEFCRSDTEVAHLETWLRNGQSFRAAGKAVGKSRQSIRAAVNRVKLRAAAKGVDPDIGMDRPSASGFRLGAYSELVRHNEDAPDENLLTWYKHQTDREQSAEIMLNAIQDAADRVSPAKKITAPKHALKDLLTLYTLTDFHFGMYAYYDETGGDWDVKIAKQVFYEALEDWIAGTPDSELAILNLQGDFLHWDGLLAVTPTAQNVLDADTRYDKLVEMVLDCLLWAVERLLQKHKRVRVLVVEGNHDIAGSLWIRKFAKKYFSKNPRVEVDDTSFPFYAYQHGSIMLAWHHGHKVKNKDLPKLFSSEPRYRSMWGQCLYTYIHSGHYHHAEQDMIEEGGAIVERHPTLCARDSHSARGGYVAWRAARAITYHKDHGETDRKTVVPRTIH